MQRMLQLCHQFEIYPWCSTTLAEWQGCFLENFALLKPHLTPTDELSESYPCPLMGGDHCPRDVIDRGNGIYDAVCGNRPHECEPLRLQKSQLVIYQLDRTGVLSPLISDLCKQEYLEPVAIPPMDWFLPLGIMVRRVGRILVILATQPKIYPGAVLELCHRAKANGVAVLIENSRRCPRQDQLLDDKIVELVIHDINDIKLWRALRMLWPESWRERAKAKGVVFEEVTLEFASTPDRHLVLLNGEVLDDFAFSDIRFFRLLLLAAARACDRNVETGGWLKKAPFLQLDEKETDLVDLRKAFSVEQLFDFAGLTTFERKALIQSPSEQDGTLRLALHPKNIRFDPSLQNLRLLGFLQAEPQAKAKKTSRRVTPGSIERARHQKQAQTRVLKMFQEARKLGVPLPPDDQL